MLENASLRFIANAPTWMDPPMLTPRATPRVRTVYNSAVAFGMLLLSTAEIRATVISLTHRTVHTNVLSWQQRKTEYPSVAGKRVI